MFGRNLLQTLMPLDSGVYVPSLKWRRAEYQALLRLDESIKDRIVPLITIPLIEFDFEAGIPKKTAIPALRLGTHQAAKAAVVRAIPYDGHGVAVIVELEDLMQSNVRDRVLGLVGDVGGHLDEADVIIDMGAPEYEPYGAFANALVGALTNLGDLGSFRNLVLVGTAIPESMSSVARGSDEIPRHDWLFYETLAKKTAAECAPTRVRGLHNRSSKLRSDIRHADGEASGQSGLHKVEIVEDAERRRFPG